MKSITKEAWSRVHAKAVEIANAAMRDDFLMVDVYNSQMLNLLDELEADFGLSPAIIATRADYLDDVVERRRLFEQALTLARSQGDQDEEAEILDSLRKLDQEN